MSPSVPTVVFLLLACTTGHAVARSMKSKGYLPEKTATFEVPSGCEIGDGVGGTEEYISSVESIAECVELVKATRPDANGATVSKALPGGCYAEFGMEESNGSDSYWTCKIEQACVQGDGIGGTEESLRDVATEQECIDLVKSMHPTANGATYSAKLPGGCYAELGMVESNGNAAWWTCKIEPSSSCVKGDGVGGTEQLVATDVESEQECIDLVKSMNPSANGATYSAALPGSCYAEFGMEESNGSESWMTCSIEPSSSCAQGDGVGGTEQLVSESVETEQECIDLVKSMHPAANGATYSAALPGSCYAEFGMEESDGNASWMTCSIEPSSSCAQGDGVGGTEQLVSESVETEQECIDLVKSMHPAANGATYLAALPGSCYAEFGMEESDGNASWMTCSIEPSSSCALGDGIGGTEQLVSESVETEQECIDLVKSMHPAANGATYSAALPGSCYAEFGMEESDGNASWMTCSIEPSSSCALGDGIGGTEQLVSESVETEQECIDLVKSMHPAANGATYSAALPGSCYAEFGMEESDGNASWMTCSIEPSSSCALGDGIGGTEQLVSESVETEQECIDLVKSMHPAANGATYSAALPGSCYAEFGMEESDGNASWMTCSIEPSSSCALGDGIGGTEQLVSESVETEQECIDLVKSMHPAANGATYSAALPGSCYAEFGMEESDGNASWMTCSIEPSSSCALGDGIGGTEQLVSESVETEQECIDLVKSMHPAANGATYSAALPGSCYAEFGMEESDGNASWMTCSIEPSSSCALGDGIGGTEQLVSESVETEQECIDLVKSMHPAANGATYLAALPGSCYAEFGMEESDGNASWMTCSIEPSSSCVLGNGVGGTELLVATDVESEQECIDLVKSMLPAANGATYSAALPGSCYAEFGMEESNGNMSWRTCMIDQPCVQGDGTGGTEELVADKVASWADCIDLVKHMRSEANGATISSDLPGSCYAEFGMDGSNGSLSWMTCKIE